MAFLLKQMKWLYQEFGLQSLHVAGRDAYLIILARCSRLLAYSATSLILALFFSALHFSDQFIGLFMTLTLLGDVLLSLCLTVIADRLGRRRVLFGGSMLMVLSGVIFALCSNFWILLFGAVVGVLSATGGDFGPFRAIEESTLSQLTTPKTRSDVLAWYVTTASLGSAVGTELSGRVVELLQGREGWKLVDAYHAVFWIYAAMGLVNMVIALLLSSKCEIGSEPSESKTHEESEILLDEMDEGEHENEDDESESAKSEPPKPEHQAKKRLFAQISKATRVIMYKLWFLLIVDSLADGMVSYSLTVYYMDRKFALPKSTLGDITSVSYILSSISTIFAAPLARRLGLINTMVFTHLPSSAAVLLFPTPSSIILTAALFFLRTGLNNMDQAPRTAFIAAVVRPEERTAVMGITSMLRTLASTAGPSVTGLLAGNDSFWIAFVVAGALRIAYDLGLWAMFVNISLHLHEENDGVGSVVDGGERRQESDEELRELPEQVDSAS